MKLLITGGTGLVGRNIIAEAQNRGVKLHYLTTDKRKIISDDAVKGFYWNPKQDFLDQKCFEGVDTLIHLAGATISKPWTPKNRKEIMESRVITSRMLSQSMKHEKIKMKQIMCASAIGIYPNSFEDTLTENSTETPENFLQEVTQAWEQQSHAMSDCTDHLSIFRIGLVLAKDEGLLAELSQPVKLFSGTAFATGKQWQSWIHINDLCQLFLFAAQAGWEGTYNAVAPKPVRQRTLIKELGRVLRRPVFLPNIPGAIIKLVMGERSVLILGSQKVSSELVVSKGFSFKYSLLPEALKDLYG
ncbi:MAG: TIGR01777 family protein [Flavobacteriaceae bacterium]|nr:TIGR01777 family protein [Flavobacteriaceae bacterium]